MTPPKCYFETDSQSAIKLHFAVVFKTFLVVSSVEITAVSFASISPGEKREFEDKKLSI